MIIAILQARCSSSRLPGKVLMPILGQPMLWHHLERVKRAKKIDKIIVATSDRPDDDDIEKLCRLSGVECFRGSLNDVLDRYYRAALKYKPSIVIRLTGDCPLTDPEIIDFGIRFFQSHDFDYVSNCVERTYPIGLDMELFDFRCLKEAWEEATLPSEREHVTPFIQRHDERYKIGHFKNDQDLSRHRWTVDEPADFEFVKKVYEALYKNDPEFGTADILALLNRQPELCQINYHIVHGEGYQKSLKEDADFLAVASNHIKK